LEVFAVFFTETTSNAPDGSKNEDVFKAFNLVMVEDVLKEFAN